MKYNHGRASKLVIKRYDENWAGINYLINLFNQEQNEKYFTFNLLINYVGG